MLDNHFVMDAVTHPFNLGPDNATDHTSAWRRTKGLYVHHNMCTPHPYDEYHLEPEEMFQDFDHDVFVDALFAESATDFALLHTLPNLGFYKHRLVEPEKAAATRDKHPDRILMYANVTPPFLDESLRSLEYQVTELGARGLKLYPAAAHGLKLLSWRMDDRRITYPIFEKALELGINNVAVHKAVTLGASPIDAFTVSDMEAAARDFPDINFQIVHAGWAYLEETALLMERYSNIYANLELTFSLIVNSPRKFAEILGQMLFFHTEDQIVYGSGCNGVHPRPGLERFRDFQMPDDLVEGMGYPELTDELKAKILGGNIARAHGLDIEELKTKIKGDEFEERKRDGYEAPWSGMRSERDAA